MTSTRKDIALKVTIVSYKRKAGTVVPTGSETDLSKMIKSNETIVSLEPGKKSQNTLPYADGFEIHISPKVATKENQGWVDKIKELIKTYLVNLDQKSDVKAVNSIWGVRG